MYNLHLEVYHSIFEVNLALSSSGFINDLLVVIDLLTNTESDIESDFDFDEQYVVDLRNLKDSDNTSWEIMTPQQNLIRLAGMPNKISVI